MRISDWSSDVCSSDLRGFLDLHLCGALPAVADIVADRVVEQHAVLRNDADRGAQASLRHLRDVLAVYGDTAASRLIEAEEEPRQGRLARARGADRSEEHTSELQSLMRNSYAVFCLK